LESEYSLHWITIYNFGLMNWYKLAQETYTMPTGVPYIDRERDGTGLLIHYPREDDEVGEKEEKKRKREKKMLRKRKGPDPLSLIKRRRDPVL